MKAPFLIVLAASAVSLAYADNPFPLNPLGTSGLIANSNIGIDYLDMTGWDSYLIGCGSLGCGGEFGGTITSSGQMPGSPTTISANFFCVDAQEDFSWGSAGYADVVPVSQVDSDPSMVRYSNVSNNGVPSWTYTPSNTSPSVALPSDSESRYAMAAWLVQQYQGYSEAGNSNGAGLNSSPDSLIQEAIWDLTSNSTACPGNPASCVDTDFAPPQSNAAVWNWVNAAETACITNSGQITASCAATASNWAVVSWSATSSNNSALTADNHQTFLVQLDAPVGVTGNHAMAPEPGLYGVLGLGVFGVILRVRQKGKFRNRTRSL